MRALWTMTWTEAKLFMREPAAVFFTLAFPLLLLLVFGMIFGNAPLGDSAFGSVDRSVPGYIAIMIGALSLIGVPITLATYREKGVLRRFRVTPMPTGLVLAAHGLVALVMVLIGTGLVVGTGVVLFDLRLPASPVGVLAATVLGCVSFLAVGFLLGGTLPTARTAQAVGMALFFPMLFLSGAALPRLLFPDLLRQISLFFPLTHVVTLIQNVWMGTGWNMVALGVLAALLLTSATGAIALFRWT
ncbi:MAG: ABC transporter permease [Bacteroidetes bacterium]|jgi:ABC-2 type transport system permease protein|nr:ABC transporter permease [Bacteroidota bacterium]